MIDLRQNIFILYVYNNIIRLRDFIKVKVFPIQPFLDSSATSINKARIEHLKQIGINLTNFNILEVGAGIGMLSGFLATSSLKLISTKRRDSRN